ncbi:putative tyrosine recombinase [Escherichia coli]|nr:putative tyrosine recombinase [Escherichia coli]
MMALRCLEQALLQVLNSGLIYNVTAVVFDEQCRSEVNILKVTFWLNVEYSLKKYQSFYVNIILLSQDIYLMEKPCETESQK